MKTSFLRKNQEKRKNNLRVFGTCTFIHVHDNDASDLNDMHWFCPGRRLMEEDIRNVKVYSENETLI